MKQGSLQKYILWVKKPAVKLAFVLVVGFIINITLFSLKVQPNFVENTLLNQTIRQLQNQRAEINRTPLPEKVDPNQIEQLILQVPTKFEISRVLLDLKRIEGESGAQIIDFSVGDRTVKVKDELADYIENALKKSPSVVKPVQNNGEEQPNPQPVEPQLATPIKPEIVSLAIHGSYQEVTEFMGLLYTIQRIINIREWSLTPIADEAYELKFVLTLYTAPRYAGTFHDLPAIQTPVPENREQPVISDNEFKQLLYP
jgi:Tfp pilus assembly protein PilO